LFERRERAGHFVSPKTDVYAVAGSRQLPALGPIPGYYHFQHCRAFRVFSRTKGGEHYHDAA
jgi:hypothetical protein